MTEHPKPRLHPFVYFHKRHSDREFRAHHQRDLSAAWYAGSALADDYSQGDLVLNTPPREKPKPHEPPRQLALPRSLIQGDALLQVTRTPLDDEIEGKRKRVLRGHNDVEEATFDVWRRYLHKSDRLHVILEQRVRAELAKEHGHFGYMTFAEAEGARLKGPGTRRPTPSTGTTVAFLLRLDEAWPRGPGLIAAFGMDGVITLGWAYRLAHDCGEFLERRGFSLVRIEYDALPDGHGGLESCDDWRIDLVVHVAPLPDRLKAASSVQLPRRRRGQAGA